MTNELRAAIKQAMILAVENASIHGRVSVAKVDETLPGYIERGVVGWLREALASDEVVEAAARSAFEGGLAEAVGDDYHWAEASPGVKGEFLLEQRAALAAACRALTGEES